MSVIPAVAKKSILEYLTLSQDDCFAVQCEKEKLCDNSLVILVAQLSNKHDAFKLESKISTANKYVIPIDIPNAELDHCLL